MLLINSLHPTALRLVGVGVKNMDANFFSQLP